MLTLEIYKWIRDELKKIGISAGNLVCKGIRV